MNPTPLTEVVYTARRLLADLLFEHNHERAVARWPRAGQHQAAIGQHNPADKTAQTAIHPDPVNTARADRIERVLRWTCRELEDCYAAGQRREATGCVNCRWRPATHRQRCEACDRYLRRHGKERPQRLAEADRSRTVYRTAL